MKLDEGQRTKLFWGTLILACVLFAFCAIDAVRLVGAHGLGAELDPLARWMFNTSPALFLIPPVLIVLIPWLCWRFINEDYGLGGSWGFPWFPILTGVSGLRFDWVPWMAASVRSKEPIALLAFSSRLAFVL